MPDCDWDLTAGALVRYMWWWCREVLDRFHHSLTQTTPSVPFLGRASMNFMAPHHMTRIFLQVKT